MNKQNITQKVLSSALFILWAGISFAQTNALAVQQLLASWQAEGRLSTASIGVAVSDSESGQVLFQTKPQQSLVPASILKLVTTATALEVFGPEFRFQTTFCLSGTVRNDTLFGDLQIIGGGDPTLGSSYFPENNHFREDWIKAIKDKNIRVVSGNLVLDASIYESQSIPDTWMWGDIGNYYGAGASGISVYDNLYRIHLKSPTEPGMPTKLGSIHPQIPGLEIRNEVLSSNINSDQAYIFGSPMDMRRVIQGTIPKNKSDFVIKGSIPNPAALLASQFREKLTDSGIAFLGITKFEKVNVIESQELVRVVNRSPALRDIIKVTNHKSINLFAEHLLKHLAFQSSGLGTTKEGCYFIINFWKDKGLDMDGFFMNDGSGLSRFNALTSMQLVQILDYMKTQSAWSVDFNESLATAGKGTLTSFKSIDFPSNSLRAKSGSMTHVRCLAGYLNTESGKELSYCIQLNNFSVSQGEAIRRIEQLLMELRKM